MFTLRLYAAGTLTTLFPIMVWRQLEMKQTEGKDKHKTKKECLFELETYKTVVAFAHAP